MLIVPRTVSKQNNDKEHASRGKPIKYGLSELRGLHSFVLLGDPGAGKSTAFTHEAMEPNCECIKARDFITFVQKPEAWQGKTIFIDGLDETRAGGLNDGRSLLDQIRQKLDQLGRPRFRISCRAADWLGESDANNLQALAPTHTDVGVYYLDPLTNEDVEKILSENFEISDTNAFIQQARHHRVDELLVNPQTLEMLANAVGKENNWPKSRHETYQLAVDKLLAEPNIEHQAAKQKTKPNNGQLLAASGYLSCLYLVADLQGFTPFEIKDAIDKSVLALNEIENSHQLPLTEAIETRVFKSIGDNIFAPRHRTVAEYLAAQFLAKAIDNHLPVGRVLAMMCGADSGVVTGLRGLHAWLAVCSSTARKKLIDNDAMGVVLYGDAKSFSVKEKIWILEATHRAADFSPASIWRDWSAHSFAALATPDMSAEFERILRKSPANQADEVLAECIVGALRYAEPMPNLGPALLDVVRTSRWSDHARQSALRAYIKNYAQDMELVQTLLEDIQVTIVRDIDDELTGTLLQHLYPRHLSPSKVVQFLHPPKKESFIGSFQMFWNCELIEKTPDELLGALLAAFTGVHSSQQKYQAYEFLTPASNLLVKGLLKLGDTVSDKTIFNWLAICLDKDGNSYLDQDAHIQLHEWFAVRPDRYKGVLRIALTEFANPDLLLWQAVGRLHGATPPADIGAWWFEHALEEQNQKLSVAYFRQSYWWDQDGQLNGVGSLEELEWRASQRNEFIEILEKSLTSDLETNEWRSEIAAREYEHAAAKKARAADFRSILPQLLNNAASTHALFTLSSAYLGHYSNVRGKTPIERLNELVDHDQELVAAAIYALKNIVHRGDLPTVAQILSSYLKGMQFLLAPALLVGLELIYQGEPEKIDTFSDEVLMKALVSRYTYTFGNEPDWFEYLVKNKPNLVSEACITYTLGCFKKHKEHIHGIYALARDKNYEVVATIAVPKLLAGFPLRARVKQLSALEQLLKAAVRYLSHKELVSVVASKLNSEKMDVGQRVYWLTTGLILSPVTYEAMLKAFVKNNQIRCGHLGQFLFSGFDSAVDYKFSESTVALLIELLGPGCQPERPERSGFITSGKNCADLVRNWINQLASSAEKNAATLLQQLEVMPELKHWLLAIRSAREAQKITMRDTHFQHPSYLDVAATLNNGRPANPADIAAIVNEVLTDISLEMRADLNIYKSFWNTDSNNKPTTAKVENGCRDVLANSLRERLKKYQVECGAEKNHADQTCSDIWCGNESWGVPIEAKRDTHKALWTALNTQLVAQYATDPKASGFGIYVVFWFGGGKDMKSPPIGAKPTSAGELSSRLEAQIAPEHRKLISVHVIDCAAKK